MENYIKNRDEDYSKGEEIKLENSYKWGTLGIYTDPNNVFSLYQGYAKRGKELH